MHNKELIDNEPPKHSSWYPYWLAELKFRVSRADTPDVVLDHIKFKDRIDKLEAEHDCD